MTDNAKIAAALVAAAPELTVVGQERTAQIGTSHSYAYANIADVVSHTRPILANHGLVALTPLHGHGDGLACTVVLLHDSGERMDLGPFPFPAGNTAQNTGSMVTYHRRYALLAALGMATGDEDDDGANAAPRQAPPATTDRPVSAANASAMTDRITEAGLDVAEVVRIGTNGRTSVVEEVWISEVAAVREAMEDGTPAEGEVAP